MTSQRIFSQSTEIILQMSHHALDHIFVSHSLLSSSISTFIFTNFRLSSLSLWLPAPTPLCFQQRLQSPTPAYPPTLACQHIPTAFQFQLRTQLCHIELWPQWRQQCTLLPSELPYPFQQPQHLSSELHYRLVFQQLL